MVLVLLFRKGGFLFKMLLHCSLEPQGSECTLWKIKFPGRAVTVITGGTLQVAVARLFVFVQKVSQKLLAVLRTKCPAGSYYLWQRRQQASPFHSSLTSFVLGTTQAQ